MSRRIPLIRALTALMFAGSAFAQPPGAQPDPATAAVSGGPTFSSYDADRDGKITREEASPNVALARQFPRLDRDRDEALDTAEFARFESQLDGSEAGPQSPEDIPQRVPRPTMPPPPPPAQ
jgi:hypothetical protein